MYSMTDSKVIHQADEAEQFQQNPQYYHRNIDPNEISTNINSMSRDVNVFLKKLLSAQNSSQISKITGTRTKEYRISKPKSQIQQISSNTQSLIEDLNWMRNTKETNRKGKFYQNSQNSINLNSQISFNQSNSIQSNRKTDTFFYSQDTIKSHNKTIDIEDKANPKFSQSKLNPKPSKTVDIYNRLSHPRPFQEQQKHRKINKLCFEKQKRQFFDEFDDKDTVVNEPHFKAHRKYTKMEVRKQRDDSQKSGKLTKKKLLEKIMKLQNSIQELKSEKYKMSYDGLRLRKSSDKFEEIFTFINPNKQSMTKIKTQQPKPKPKHMFKTNNDTTVKSIPSQRKQISQIRSDTKKITYDTKDISAKSRSQSTKTKINFSCKGQDRKISLSKWVQDVWEDQLH